MVRGPIDTTLAMLGDNELEAGLKDLPCRRDSD